MTTLATELSAQRTAPDASGVAEPAQDEARLRDLFRLWLRDGHVHPLIHLIRQFKCGERT
ncbi:MAG TPA: hypothetical protein VH278_04650 [Burkholderiaceae bacterium]|nr:hypothetical protein [Burkholderiaceae bacterium]